MTAPGKHTEGPFAIVWGDDFSFGIEPVASIGSNPSGVEYPTEIAALDGVLADLTAIKICVVGAIQDARRLHRAALKTGDAK